MNRRLAVASAIAVALVVLSFHLPLWKMTLEAPQYPQGLHLRAYGNRIEGDLREVNIINHYVGMAPIEAVPAPEMKLFGAAVALLAILAAAAPFHRRVRQLAVLAMVLVAVVTLVDLQLYLREFGQNLNPEAPFRLEPFTPRAIGTSRIGNFTTHSMVSWGFFCLLGAALSLALGAPWRRERKSESPLKGASSVVAAAVVLLSVARADTLQERIDAAPPGGTLRVVGGVHHGPIRVRGPLTLEGVDWPVVDGGGTGSVVLVEGENVVIRGFVLRNSGRHVSEEAAAIKACGSRHLFEKNRIEDVYFGIHLSDGSGNRVRGNMIFPGEDRSDRPGHGISLWYQKDARVVSNVIGRARDGVYLSYADDVLVEDNEVSGSRYGVHSMSSSRSVFERNRLRGNLLGAALMYSREIVMRSNRIEDHREGATAYGILLKDIGEVRLEGNVVLRNRVGIYADAVPLGPSAEALVIGNLLAGNDTALALQSTVRLAFAGNRVEGNLMAVRSEGAALVSNVWSRDGRGNYWDDYRGFDRDGDGIGDLPYRYEAVMNEMLRKEPLTRAFVYTPAHLALEAAARLFPVLRSEPLVVDEHPLMSPGGKPEGELR